MFSMVRTLMSSKPESGDFLSTLLSVQQYLVWRICIELFKIKTLHAAHS